MPLIIETDIERIKRENTQLEVTPKPLYDLGEKTNQEIISLHAQCVSQGALFPNSKYDWTKREHMLYDELIGRMEK